MSQAGLSGHDYRPASSGKHHFAMDRSAKGRRVQMVIGGQVRTLGTVGEMAAAFRRKSHTIRRWEASGLIPPAPLIVQPGKECTRRRLYPAELISAVQQLAVDQGFGTRRRSGQFVHQQEQIWSTWKAVIDSLNSGCEPGVVGEAIDRAEET